jgi:hypothetical protein
LIATSVTSQNWKKKKKPLSPINVSHLFLFFCQFSNVTKVAIICRKDLKPDLLQAKYENNFLSTSFYNFGYLCGWIMYQNLGIFS